VSVLKNEKWEALFHPPPSLAKEKGKERKEGGRGEGNGGMGTVRD